MKLVSGEIVIDRATGSRVVIPAVFAVDGNRTEMLDPPYVTQFEGDSVTMPVFIE